MAVRSTHTDGSMKFELRDNHAWSGFNVVTRFTLDPEEADRLGEAAWGIMEAIAEGLNEND